ncbi:cilia- and flagella-associated protein 61 [Drosophila montana]|uniref:cilia- and flagella-associated protein 61 n=1 Tax=Drosophila montana TaxID=40370 RepID=UPI00313B552C
MEYEIRTASKNDIDQLESLFSSKLAEYFGEKRKPPLSQLFQEYQTHRLVVCQPKGPRALLAYSEFCIYPNIPVLSNDCWPQWLKCRFCVDLPITLMNTIFFNFYIHMSEHANILNQLIMEVFYREHKVSFLVVTRPPNYSPKEFEQLEKIGKIYYPIAFDMFSCRNLPTIIVVSRSKFMPSVAFRKALPEDNDDVIDMIDVYEPERREEHGDFFIAELLLGTAGSDMEKNKVIVTEESGSTTGGSTGMMWLTEEVDIEELIRNFDLESLGNLVTCTPDVPHASVQFDVFTAEQRQYFNLKKNMSYFKRRSVSLRKDSQRSVYSEYDPKELVAHESLFTKFKYITDELSNSSNYLDKVSKTLNISFDMPARKSMTKNRKYCLNNASRAFVLKNFILHPSLRLEYTFYYLCAMFSAYPDRDYCVVPLAPGAKNSVSLWALLKFFIRVQHRPSSEMSDEVFVAHRCSINTELSIYHLVKDDVEDVIKLLSVTNQSKLSDDSLKSGRESHIQETISHQIKIIKQISSDVLYNPMSEFSFWIIRCGHTSRENTTAVGFAILRPFSNYEAVYKQFVLPHDEDYMTFDRCELVMLRLHPYFHMWSDEVLRTVAIRSGYREIFYFQEIIGEPLPNDLAQKMMPVEPRRLRRNWFIDTQSEHCYRRSSTQVDLSKINCVMDQFYLFRHNLFPSKFMGNQNPIVIVGFSDICKAFLRLMVFGWNTPDYKYVNVNNCLPIVDITVIVKNGEIEAEYDPNVACQYCYRKEECYLSNKNSSPFVMDTTQRLDMRNWINFVSGKVTYIDRAEKFIRLDNNCKVFYDKLLLLCDTKFGLPTLGRIDESNHAYPYNYAHINGRLDKIMLYHKLEELNDCVMIKKKVIIYGYTLALYECIDFLLKHNCRPENIVYVQPHKVMEPEYLNNPTNDRNLDNILVQMVSDLGIKVYESANFVSFSFYANASFIDRVYFKLVPSGNPMSLSCSLFINFMENFMPMSIEQMLIKSDIHMRNRKILVDEDYCTNDPHIYAAGKHVTFGLDSFYQYIYTSEREMAQKLIDILQLSQEPYTKERKFSKPCLFHCLLPLGHMVIKITVPKRFLLGKLTNEYSHIMTSYCSSGDFFRVRLNPNLLVEEIVCVTRKLYKPLYFLEYFCGKHETLLNNMNSRWKMGLIKNFVSFFEAPWTEYLMHDRFDDMQTKNHDTLIALLQHMHCGVKGMNIGDTDFGDACKNFLEANLLKFLRKYRKEFINEFALPEDWEVEEQA